MSCWLLSNIVIAVIMWSHQAMRWLSSYQCSRMLTYIYSSFDNIIVSHTIIISTILWKIRWGKLRYSFPMQCRSYPTPSAHLMTWTMRVHHWLRRIWTSQWSYINIRSLQRIFWMRSYTITVPLWTFIHLYQSEAARCAWLVTACSLISCLPIGWGWCRYWWLPSAPSEIIR